MTEGAVGMERLDECELWRESSEGSRSIAPGMTRVAMLGGIEFEGEWELFVLSADALRVGFGRCGLSVDVTGLSLPDDMYTLNLSLALGFASSEIELDETGSMPRSFWLEGMPFLIVLSELEDGCSFCWLRPVIVAEVPASVCGSREEFECRPGLVF